MNRLEFFQKKACEQAQEVETRKLVEDLFPQKDGIETLVWTGDNIKEIKNFVELSHYEYAGIEIKSNTLSITSRGITREEYLKLYRAINDKELLIPVGNYLVKYGREINMLCPEIMMKLQKP